MNELTLYRGITMLDDALIEEAQEAKPKKRPAAWVKWGAAAACVCVVAAGALVWWANKYDTASCPVGENTAGAFEAEIYVVPHWEDLTDAERYWELEFDGRIYSRGRTAATATRSGGALGEAELSGWDQYANERHSITKTVYAIDGISAECAVKARFDGETYAYVNPDYKPATLGQFIDDLDLTDTLELGAAWYYWYGSGGGSAGTQIDGFDDRLVWDELLRHTDAASVENYDLTHFERKKFSVSVNIPVLGYENISLWLTEDGYLHTNILETGKAFYIGEDAVRAFLSAVEERYHIDPARLERTRAPQTDGDAVNSSEMSTPASTTVPSATVPPN